jgi:integrase
VIVWQTATARLLPRLLKGRTAGPVFVTDRRARVELPPGDLDPTTGRARLSYRRAAELFEQATGGWTLHQLRHSALTHAAETGANTSTLLAYSGHTSVASLARYARVSPRRLPVGSNDAIPPGAADPRFLLDAAGAISAPGRCAGEFFRWLRPYLFPLPMMQ